MLTFLCWMHRLILGKYTARMEFTCQISGFKMIRLPKLQRPTSMLMVLIFHILKVMLVEKLNCNGLSSEFMFVLYGIGIVLMDFILDKNHVESVKFCLPLLWNHIFRSIFPSFNFNLLNFFYLWKLSLNLNFSSI